LHASQDEGKEKVEEKVYFNIVLSGYLKSKFIFRRQLRKRKLRRQRKKRRVKRRSRMSLYNLLKDNADKICVHFL